jgi:hypothetical protein
VLAIDHNWLMSGPHAAVPVELKRDARQICDRVGELRRRTLPLVVGSGLPGFDTRIRHWRSRRCRLRRSRARSRDILGLSGSAPTQRPMMSDWNHAATRPLLIAETNAA